MKLLWITNVLFPDMAKELGEACPVMAGWAKAAADILLQRYPNIKLAVATPYLNCTEVVRRDIDGVAYYCIPTNMRRYESHLESIWRNVRDEFQPDVVHLHGTEFAHGLSYLRGCGNDNVVISIQGLVSVICRYEKAGISPFIYLKNITLRHIIKGGFGMKKRAKYEIPILKEGKHFIGRTLWDKTHIWAHNPVAQYYFCNETLRPPFYSAKWDVNKCERYRIFLSQASQPLKGLHQLIKALPLILRHYPDTKVYIAGNDFLKRNGIMGYLKTSTYANIIRNMMKKYNVEKKLIFLGPQSAEEMTRQLLKANVYICTSSVENSPNSLGEAQLVGTPSISSYVGGTMDMIEHNVSGMLYRFEEHEILAKHVCDIFTDASLAMRLSKNAQERAQIRHDEKINADTTYQIYESIHKSNSRSMMAK